MLRQLVIKNFAIIDDLTIDFQNGFNVLTGETGAGKSIIIDALGILSGDRGNAGLVRHGANKAFIEGIFELNNLLLENVKKYIEDFDDNNIYLSRDIYSDGRSISKINGRNIPLNIVRELAAILIDIHSQHDNQYLLNPNAYLTLLDNFGKEDIKIAKKEYISEYNIYLEINEKLNKIKALDLSKEDIDFLNFQIAEIENLALKENEIEELENEEKRFLKHEFIAENMNNVLNYLGNENGISENLYLAYKALQKIADDELFVPLYQELEEIYYHTTDFLEKIRSTFDSLDFDQERLMYIKERLYNINKIKRKHGRNFQEINEKLNEMKEKVIDYNNFEQLSEELNIKLSNQIIITRQKGIILSELRKKVAKNLEKNILQELKDLYLEKAIFEVMVVTQDNLLSTGIDKIDFLVTMNPGQPLKSLAKVASGGEISRLMLGLKSIFNRLHGIDIAIFDEIDTGVSGKVARAVGFKMKNLSKDCQILCITHLAQVASLADYHYHVDKKIKENSTFTVVTLLNDKQRIEEIAKLISGNNISEVTLAAAEELINNH